MAIHFLNTLTIQPLLTPIRGGVTCLLVDTNQGSVLVDTGSSTRDPSNPNLKLRLYNWFFQTSQKPEQTAFNLVLSLGYRPEDVRHILVSHMHLDHAGGLADFPWAKVHIYRREYQQIMEGANWKYLPEQWSHEPEWFVHDLAGEKWFDFDAIHLDGFIPEIWLVPLIGHTPGLVGVAIQEGGDWILYGADSLPYDARVDLVPRWFAKYFMYHHAPRLREFVRHHPEVRLVSGHMALGFYEN